VPKLQVEKEERTETANDKRVWKVVKERQEMNAAEAKAKRMEFMHRKKVRLESFNVDAFESNNET